MAASKELSESSGVCALNIPIGGSYYYLRIRREGAIVAVTDIGFACNIVGKLAQEDPVRYDEAHALARSMKQIYMTLMGFLTAIFSASLSLQTTLSASSDSVAMRTAKYAVGQMLPTVGSTIGATLSTRATSMNLIKTTVGAGGVGVLLMLLLPPVIELYLFSLTFSTKLYLFPF